MEETLYSPVDIDSIIRTGTDYSSVSNDDVTVIDKEWITSRFMLSDKELSDLDARNRYFSTTSYKFTDTSLGGNVAINPRPQFTRYCDIRGSSRITRDPVTVSNRSAKVGMGRYYSEAIDDNVQQIFMTFGIPKFNSLVNFFTRAIDYTDSVVANTGRLPIGYKVGQVIGGGVMLAAFPLITLTIWAVKLTSKLVLGSEEFNYYYMEPAMPQYWASVNSIGTMLATEMGILIPELMNDGTKADRMGIPVKINQDDLNEMRRLLPGLISDNNYIDIFAIAVRPQAIANAQYLRERELYESDPSGDFDMVGYVTDDKTIIEGGSTSRGFMAGVNSALSLTPKVVTFTDYINKLVKGDGLFSDKIGEAEEKKAAAPTDSKDETKYQKNEDGTYPVAEDADRENYLTRLASAFDSSVRDGGLHAVFNVDYTGSVSESFSNSVGEIGLTDKIKSVSASSRNIKFDLAGGNIAGPIKDVIDGATGVLNGLADSMSFGLSSVIQTITGNGFVDIPKKWDDSDMSLPSITYNIQLISPYGNTISQFQNIYIPLAMLLAGALPQATGPASYTSPFLCSLFCKGVQTIKMGMITSLSITRGTSNLGFSRNKRPLAIDVSFTVTDFSTRITAPVNSSIFGAFNVALNDSSPLGNYLGVLGSRDLLTNKYTLPKIKLRASRLLMGNDKMLSPAAWGLRTGSLLNGILGGALADHNIAIAGQKNKF